MSYEPPKKTVEMAQAIVSTLEAEAGLVLVPALFASYPDWLGFYTPDHPRVVEDAMLRLHFLKRREVYEFEAESEMDGMIEPPPGVFAIAIPIKEIFIPKRYIRQ